MIRLTLPTWGGKHIAIITKATDKEILYAHSGEHSQNRGPHVEKISILKPNAGLEKQKWHERHEDGSNYGKHAFHPEKGDSVRRLKYLLDFS